MLTPLAVADVLVDEREMEKYLRALDFEKDLADCLKRKNYCNQGLYLIVKNPSGEFMYTPLDAHEIGKYTDLPRIQCEPLYYENIPKIVLKDLKRFPELELPFIYPTQAAKNYFLVKIQSREAQESEHGPRYTFRELQDNPKWK